MTLGELSDDTAVLICGHVFRREEDVGLVEFAGDGPQAVCRLQHDGAEAEADAKLVSMKSLRRLMPGLGLLGNLEWGQAAWKTGPNEWTVETVDDDKG